MKNLNLMLHGFILLALSSTSGWGQLPLLQHWNGDSPFDQLGQAVAWAGDTNGDGFSDFLVGVPLADSNGFSSGRVKLYSGQDGSLLLTIDGSAAGDHFGSAVAGAGDVNGDGFDDIVVGAPLAAGVGPATGKALVYSGATGALLHSFSGNSAGDQFGTSVAGAGDVDNDGFQDLIVGAPFDDPGGLSSGSAWVFSGDTGALLFSLPGSAPFEAMGTSVAGLGDTNGDGLSDLLVGATGVFTDGSQAGAAYLFSGLNGSLLHVFDGDAPGDHFGFAVAAAGDLNGDGVSDLIVGAPLADALAVDGGEVKVFSGTDGLLLHTYRGQTAFDHFGWSVSSAGDVNGDEIPDLLVGAPLENAPLQNAGSVHLYSGLDFLQIRSFPGTHAFDHAGISVGGGGDANGDHFDNFIVGIDGSDIGGPNTGRADVLAGAAVLPFGTNLGGSQSLVCEWLHGDPGSVSSGLVRISGAAPGASGLAGMSLGMASLPALGSTLLVDLNPETSSIININFNATGSAFLPFFNMNTPSLNGIQIYVQGLEISPAAPQGALLSNGLALLFSR